MINMIKADLFRMIRSKSIYIIIAVMLTMTIVSAATKTPGTIANANYESMEEMDMIYEIAEEENTNDLSSVLSKLDSKRSDEQKKEYSLKVIGSNMNLYYLIVFIVYGVLAADLSNKTIKNTLTSISGRKKYFFSKLIFILGSSTLLILLNTLTFYGINMIVNGEKYSVSLGRMLEATLMQLPMLLGLTALLTFIVYLVKSGAWYNSISLLGIILFQTVLLMLNSLLKCKAITTYLEKYEAQSAIFKLAVHPEISHTVICCIIGIGMFLVSVIASYYIFKKAEIN